MSEKTQNYGIDQGIGTNRVIDWARDGRELWYEFTFLRLSNDARGVFSSSMRCLIMKSSFFPIYRGRKCLEQYQPLRYSLRKQIHDEFKAMRFMEFAAQDVRTCKK